MHVNSVISRLNFKYERTNEYIFNAHLQGLTCNTRMNSKACGQLELIYTYLPCFLLYKRDNVRHDHMIILVNSVYFRGKYF